MAKKQRRRVRDTWKEKSWFTIKTPVAFQDKEIGETPAKDADYVIGRTVEVTSPDSEGRMILADAIGYANKHYNVKKIFSIATLTGLSEIAFGDYMTPYWSTTDETAIALYKLSKLSGDGVVPLPLANECFEQVNNSSEIADCANGCKERNYSNGTAAAFINTFCKCKDFTHFDIAGTNLFKKYPVNPLGFLLYLFAVDHFEK